jgi:diadenosine tetraphosphate (Ap4A) HIT family hydrolase
MTNDQCALCKMVKRPEVIISEDNHNICVVNEWPFSSYHLMIIPKRHVEFVTELNNEELRSFTNMVHFYSQKIMKVSGHQGSITWIHYGDEFRSQKHLHVQIISGLEGLHRGVRGLVEKYYNLSGKRKFSQEEIDSLKKKLS